MMQTAQMLLSELVDKVSKCSKNRLEMQMVGADVAVSRFMSPAEAGEGDMSFLTDPRYAEAMKATKAAAIVLCERRCQGSFWRGAAEPHDALVRRSVCLLCLCLANLLSGKAHSWHSSACLCRGECLCRSDSFH